MRVPGFHFAARPPGRRRSRPLNAFTLLEVITALALMALLVAAMYSTFVLVMRSSETAQIAAAQAQRQRVAIHTIEDALESVQSYQASMKYYTFIVSNGEPQSALSFTARVPDIFPRNGKFGDLYLRRLNFSVDDKKNLILRQSPILMDMDDDEQNYPLILAKNVKLFAVDCWDTNAVDWVQEWTDTNTIPPMVRITLVLNASSEPNAKPLMAVTRAVAIPSTTLPASLQNGQTGGGPGNPLGGIMNRIRNGGR